MAIEIDDATLNQVLSELESELVPILKGEVARLAKGEGDEPEASSPEAPEGPPEETPGEDHPGSPPVESASPEASSPGSPPESPAPEASSPGMPADPAQMEQMVQSLPPEQQDALYMCLKQAIFARHGSPAPAGPEASAPPASPPTPAPAPPPAMKSEGVGTKGQPAPKPGVEAPNANGDHVVGKSEVDELKALAKSQSEKIELLTKAVDLIARTPVRKAVTSVAALVKAEPERPALTKSEVNSRLKALDKKRLTKADRDAINRVYDTHYSDASLRGIAHLLA